MDNWPYQHAERAGRGRSITHKLKSPWLFEGEEEFPELGGMKQTVQIGDFEDFGRGLVIDGMSQLAEAIEPAYTSALIFPAALTARSRSRWLIAGGGDGPAPREALAFEETERVKLVDISRMVIEKTQELVPSFWGGCQNDPRLDNDPRDVFAFMRETDEKFDIIVSDLTDPEDEEYTPFSESTADRLYTEEGLRLFAKCLAPYGVFVMQAQELSMIRSAGHMRLRELVKRVFPLVYSYRIFIEFFGYWESFLVAATGDAYYHFGGYGFSRQSRKSLEFARYKGNLGAMWNHEVGESLFALPPALGKKV